jgi:hypothetical protein
MIWANLLHLSYNMWWDHGMAPQPGLSPHLVAQPYLRFDDNLWRDLLRQMAEAGGNMVVIDVGDGVQFASHPEISVEGAWTAQRLKEELAATRAMGIEPIPKMNFSTAHDVWLAEYSRQVSAPQYYEVCRDLIAEVIELFDKPRFFHLGMDEEDAHHQRRNEYCVVRQFDLWWRDLYFLVEQVEKAGVRAWVWSDYVWNHPEEFFARMPKSVVQSNWYYDERFENIENELQRRYVEAYLKLEAHGYDQIPTGSNWTWPHNMEHTVEYLRDQIAPERLLGFMTAPWHPTLEEYRQHHTDAIEQLGRQVKRSSR